MLLAFALPPAIAGEKTATLNKAPFSANNETQDLYLLGTVNGETAWHPYGPQFTFDATNQVYYIDVYFKGDSLYNNGQGDRYGHFSLTTKISQDPNGWGEISASRIYAASQDYWVENGNTYNNCFQTNTDYAFKIPAGVYRITVSAALDQMTITEYKPTFVFTPAGGETQDNPVVVDAGTNVVMTSNLEQLVHDINPNESSHATFYNTTDNWATNEHDNTREISANGVTTLIGNANLGYIKAQDTAYYEVVDDLYLLGTANEKTAWVPYGPKFTYDANAGGYYIDVYFKGYNDDNNAEDGFGYFSLSTKIGSNANDWGSISGYRLYATSHDYLVGDGTVANNCFQTNTDHAFKIPAGVYRITVNKAKSQMSVTEYPLTLTFDPVSGSTVNVNDVVTITSNLDALVHNINANEVNSSFRNSIDGGTTWDNDNTATITAVGTTTTVNAEDSIGYIKVTGTATYTIPVPIYNIYTECVPSDAGHFNFITALNQTSQAGKGIFFTVSAHTGYRLVKVTMSYVDENNETQTTTLVREDGEYYFVMPAADVTLTAEFVRLYNITGLCIPVGAGSFNGLASRSAAGSDEDFFMTTNSGYRLRNITLSYVDENNETQTSVLPYTSGIYHFTMPAADVTLTAVFDPVYRVFMQSTPSEGGTINLSENQTFVVEGTPISFTVTSNAGYAVTDVTMAYVDENDVNQLITLIPNENGVYSFTMPAANVTLNANFAHIPYGISTVCDSPEGGTINVAATAYTNDLVEFTIDKEPYYELTGVTVTNDVTGQVTELTPDQNGHYHFTMPDAAVTITAHFAPITDLYLLGTANGATEWAPTGPKFDYDPVTDQYTLTVYFKGIRDVAGQTDDQSGYFSLTTVVHESDWDYIAPYRLVPNRAVYTFAYPPQTYPLYSTTDGYDANNKFLVGAGVYRLTVPSDKSSITVTKIPVTLTQTTDDVVVLGGKTFVPYGTVVTASSDLDQIVHNINPNEDDAVFSMITMTGHPHDGPQYSIVDTISGNQVIITTEGQTQVKANAYIGWIVPSDVKNYYYHNLRYLERDPSETINQAQVVCDTLVGVWAAEKVLWAKDLGNKSVSRDNNGYNLVDYGIDIAHMQDSVRGWDQSNWVMLDFSEYLEEETNDEALEVLNLYVNKQLKPMSIRGYYNPDCTYRITVYDVPIGLKDTIGYPGYLQDPLELLAKPTGGAEPVIYHYNHYTPCNFMKSSRLRPGNASGIMPPSESDWEELEAWVRSHSEFAELYDYDWSDPDNWTEDQWDTYEELFRIWNRQNSLFFVRGKASEVAHVWGVWRGDDVFDVYERYVSEDGDTIYNQYDLSGAFKVGGWQYNRLTPTPAYYGKPVGEQSLHVNEAYEFHIAIVKPGYNEQPNKSMRRAPVAKGCNPNDEEYLIYPLDLMSHDDNVTFIPELSSVTADRTVLSVRYYNLMGQESKTPFDGINIEVTRYNDGSMTTRKILR